MRTSTDILIVGGGPVGLMLAGELQRRGIDHLVIDQRPQPEYYCKALGITPRTLEVWDQIGVLEGALRLGRFTVGITGSQNGEQTGVETARPCGMPFGFMTLAQYDTEQLLRRHLARHGGRVHHDATLLDFEMAADRVRARVRTGGAERTIECAYLAGCDGAHSTVRKQLGLDYEGDAYPMTFMLGDVRLHWDRPRQYGHRLSQIVDGQLQNMLICIPIPGDPQRYRLSMAAPPEYWEEHADLHTPPTFEQLAAAAAAMLPPGAQISDLRWSSFYRISHRIASRYRNGRGFLVGDAAHIHPPIGGQGMNTGLQDAHNLGWKLALTVRGLAPADLLDSYDAERRPVGRAVVERTTHRMDDSLTERGVKFDQWLEDSQLLINYRDSAWVAEDVAASALISGPRAGDRAPDVPGLRREWVASAQRLAELLRHEGHTVLLYFDRTAAPSQYERAAALADALASAHGDAIAVYGVAHRDARPVDLERFPLLSDADGNFAIAFGADRPCLHVIRPDGYFGYRCDRIDRTALDAYLRRILVPANRH